MSDNTNTRIYLLYNNENIEEYLKDPRIYPLQLSPQTIYFESDGFRKISTDTIPEEIKYIGFITPSFFKKSNGKPLSSFRHNGEKNTVIGVHTLSFHSNYLDLAQMHHSNFRVLWEWLINNMGILAYQYPYKNIHMYANMWMAKRDIAIEAIDFICKGVNVLESAPENVRKILYSDPKYGGKLKKEELFEKFGIHHYPYHPFILERLIIFFCDIRGLTVKPLP